MRPGWAFLPALGGALAHAPVLRFDLLGPLKRPLDGGATLGGHRLFGDNKTLRGALLMASVDHACRDRAHPAAVVPRARPRRAMRGARWRMTALEAAEAFAVVAAVHAALNVVGYAAGARSSPV